VRARLVDRDPRHGRLPPTRDERIPRLRARDHLVISTARPHICVVGAPLLASTPRELPRTIARMESVHVDAGVGDLRRLVFSVSARAARCNTPRIELAWLRMRSRGDDVIRRHARDLEQAAMVRDVAGRAPERDVPGIVRAAVLAVLDVMQL
jgi:hypothetical protein